MSKDTRDGTLELRFGRHTDGTVDVTKHASFDGVVVAVRMADNKQFSTIEFFNPSLPFVSQNLVLLGTLPLGTKVVISVEANEKRMRSEMKS